MPSRMGGFWLNHEVECFMKIRHALAFMFIQGRAFAVDSLVISGESCRTRKE